jgi:FlaA1/EpsC-like NDP-sugar epimerase
LSPASAARKVKQIALRYRLLLIVPFQLALFASCYLAALVLRFGRPIPHSQWAFLQVDLPALLVIKLSVFWYFGFFTGWWQYVSMADLIALFKASCLSTIVFLLYLLFAQGIDGHSRAVLVLDWGLCFSALAGTRFAARAFREYRINRKNSGKKRLLILGAGVTGQMAAKELRANGEVDASPVGFLDDDPEKQGQVFQGLRVLGDLGQIAKTVRQHQVDLIVLALKPSSHKSLKAILDDCLRCKVEVRILPNLAQVVSGQVTVNQLRKVDVEDLLGRETVDVDYQAVARDLYGQVVMVTGAGGSIGSEVCRQVAGFGLKALVLFEINEYNLYSIEMELSQKYPDLRIFPIIGDVQSVVSVHNAMDYHRPAVVYHAAAYKHVPMMELNPMAAVNNNVLGTLNVAVLAARSGAKKFVMISTDKAVRPTNIMGASKRAAELVLHSIPHSRTVFVAVRFGNVLRSSGSVIPLFEKQIAEGGPVTVTHPEVTRYFMTIPEATSLVLQAGSQGKSRELFLLDMGAPVRIRDLAENLIKLSGLEPGKDIEIRYTGLRPGEKIFEELLVSGEGIGPTEHPKIFVVRGEPDHHELQAKLRSLILAGRRHEHRQVLRHLRELVEGFTPEMNSQGDFKWSLNVRSEEAHQAESQTSLVQQVNDFHV